MSFEKTWRRFKKQWKQGRYRKGVMYGCSAAAAVCVLVLGVYFVRGHMEEAKIDDLREKKEAGQTSYGTGGIMAQYQELFRENPDLVGWLTIDGTNIDYPVMWTPEDPEYYSHRGFDRKDSENGLLFMDEASDLETYGGNVIIYGHNMKNGSMFADLLNYEEQSFYEDHAEVQLDTLYESRRYEIVAVLKSADMSALPFDFTDPSRSGARDVVESMRENALYDTGVKYSFGDDFLTLATCDYSEADGRLVVVARRTQ